MRERTFSMRRREGWERLETLLERSDRSGLRGFKPVELQELALLYRAATSDLAAAQTRGYSSELRAYLNRLTARGYVVVHAGSVEGGWERIATFFAVTFPREVRRSGKIVLATTALFIAAWIVSYSLVAARPANAYALLPAAEIPTIAKSLHDSNFGFDRSLAPAMSSEIITNNIKVAMLAFAGGMTLGVLTLWEILNNGLMVGALGALFAAHGFGTDFYATIAPHGVIELSSIQIAGASGLLLAKGIVAPGRLRRIDALKANARRAGVLMLGVAGLLVIAGFITPQRTTEIFRLGVGAATAVALIAYFAFGGRGTQPKEPDDAHERDGPHIRTPSPHTP
jgi:uncharacterized membrane protein SpoIIM required for sporulation